MILYLIRLFKPMPNQHMTPKRQTFNFKLKHKGLFPLFVLACLLAVTLYDAIFDGFHLQHQHYFAAGLFILCLVVYFIKSDVYIICIITTLILFLFNLVVFTKGFYLFKLRISLLQINFQPHALILLVLTIALYRKQVYEFIQFMFNAKLSPEEKAKQESIAYAQGVVKFKEQYKRYSTEQLTSIVQENTFVPKAVEAARLILEERSKFNNF